MRPRSRFGLFIGAALLIGAAIAPGPALGIARGAAPTAMVHGGSADLAAALGADGTFHGAPGVTGVVDVGTWTLVSSLDSGEPPRFAHGVEAVATPVGPWSALGSNGSGNGALNNTVLAVAVSGSDLYVGGQFFNAGGIAEADYVARWNGSAWSALGSNGPGTGALFGFVNVIAVAGSDVYVGGNFTNAAGIPEADYVARWNGSAWSSLGSNGIGIGAITGHVYALAVSGSDVYVGGSFVNAGGIAEADAVARWDGGSWFALGSNGAGGPAIGWNLLSSVWALAISGTDLYVGGQFIDAGGIVTADNIARWNGSAWSALGSNGSGNGAVAGPVYALAAAGTDLFAGGQFFDLAGIAAADHVARWSGTAWSALGSSAAGDGALNNRVRALAVSGTDLYVGGVFANAAGVAAADHVARWSGTTWSALGSNGSGDGAITNGSGVWALAAVDTAFTMGGGFADVAGIAAADNIARWAPAPPVVLRPDGRIRVGTGVYVGNNLYNTTGAGQGRTGSATRGRSVTFGISIQNDGTGSDRFRVRATGTSTTRYTVKYFRGTTDITAAVVAGTYRTPLIAKAGTYLITARVTVKSTAAIGSKVTRLVTLTSVGNSTRKDAVTFTGKRK